MKLKEFIKYLYKGFINTGKGFEYIFEWEYIEFIENGFINKGFINGFVFINK